MNPVQARAELAQVWGDPWEFANRLFVADQFNHLHRLNQPWEEQLPWIRALLGSRRYVLGLKPRQLGFTTWTAAFEFHATFTAPYPRLCLSVCHDEDTRTRLRGMVDTFRENLPSFWQSPYLRGADNYKSSLFSHNKGGFHRRVAGAKGKARSYTFNDLHATEMAFWSTSTSASRRDAAGSDDATMFSSAMATMHDPNGRVIVESTGNGPSGLFYELCQQAQNDPKWEFVFVPWNRVARYREELTPIERRDLEQELTPTELEMIRDHGLTLEQVAWRRTRMRTLRYTELRFQREYPLTVLDPFMLDESGWFDQLALARQLRYVPDLGASEEAFRQFHPPEPGRRYFMGVDTSGGVGRDHAVIQLVDLELRHVAIWSSNRASIPEQARWVSRIGQLYGGPDQVLAVIEANHFGERVISRVSETGGVRLWKGDDDQDFWSTGGTAGQTKREAMVYARELIEQQWTAIADSRTIREAQTVVEKDNGKIEASGDKHDDHIMAYVFALWAARRARRMTRDTQAQALTIADIKRNLERGPR